ncbi:MAG TPA: ribosome biogenesis factor YjgA [Nitrosospira sp.]|nr:ribosome biogenesis factor YjgA [Nitrosospira sp.]
MDKKPEDDREEHLPPSKTRQKKEMHARQDIGERLAQLDPKSLSTFDLPEGLADAINDARSMRAHGARRRQMQLIGKLMREVDPVPIQKKLDALNRPGVQQTARLHLLERWRDRLLADEKGLMDFAQAYPAADLQHLGTLVRDAKGERLANKPPRQFRELFQELQRIVPENPGTKT